MDHYRHIDHADRDQPEQVDHPISLLITCCLLSIATAPFFINWIPFEHMLQREGVYSLLCEDKINTSTGCPERRSAFILLEESSIAASYVFASIGGFAYEKYGGRITALIGFTCQMTGVILLAYCGVLPSAQNAPLMLVGGGAMFSFYGLIEIGRTLFKGNPSLIIGFFGGFRSIGLCISLILNHFSTKGYSTTTLFQTYAAVLGFLWVVCYCLLPHPNSGPHFSVYGKPMSRLYTRTIQIIGEARTRLVDDADIDAATAAVDDYDDFDYYLHTHTHASRKLIAFLTYFVVIVLIQEWYSSSLSWQKENTADLYATLRPWAFLAGPMIGLCLEQLGVYVIMYLMTTVAAFLCLFRLLPMYYPASQSFPIIFSLTMNAFSESQWYATIPILFPGNSVGKITALALVIAGIATTLITPLQDFSSENKSYCIANAFMLLLSLLG